MKMDYEHYKLTILEWARYLGESVLICVVIDALCYQSLITFLFMLPIPFWYIRPVSYTHLDVYKRQAMSHTGQASPRKSGPAEQAYRSCCIHPAALTPG